MVPCKMEWTKWRKRGVTRLVVLRLQASTRPIEIEDLTGNLHCLVLRTESNKLLETTNHCKLDIWSQERCVCNPAKGCNMSILDEYGISSYLTLWTWQNNAKYASVKLHFQGFRSWLTVDIPQALHCQKHSVRVSDISRTHQTHIQWKMVQLNTFFGRVPCSTCEFPHDRAVISWQKLISNWILSFPLPSKWQQKQIQHIYIYMIHGVPFGTDLDSWWKTSIDFP